MTGYYLLSYHVNNLVAGIEQLIKKVEEGIEAYKHVRINETTWIIRVEGDTPDEHMGDEIHSRVTGFYHNVLITRVIIISVSKKDLLEAFHYTGEKTEELLIQLTKDQR